MRRRFGYRAAWPVLILVFLAAYALVANHSRERRAVSDPSVVPTDDTEELSLPNGLTLYRVPKVEPDKIYYNGTDHYITVTAELGIGLYNRENVLMYTIATPGANVYQVQYPTCSLAAGNILYVAEPDRCRIAGYNLATFLYIGSWEMDILQGVIQLVSEDQGVAAILSTGERIYLEGLPTATALSKE